jgi:hypothetical protein
MTQVIELIRDIIANPSTAPISSYRDELTVTTGALTALAASQPYNFDAIDAYMVRVWDAGFPEYTVMFLRSLTVYTARDNKFMAKFCASKSYARFATTSI